MENIEYKFCKELQTDLLNGATIVYHKAGKFIATILVRLPKDKTQWREGMVNGYTYEYVQYTQLNNCDMYEASLRNGTIKSVIKTVSADHITDEIAYKKINAMQNEQK